MTADVSRPDEPGRQQKAFEIYLALGDTRTYQQVASQMGVALATVKRWAKANNWQGRVQTREAELARNVANHYATSRLTRIERNLKLIHAGLLRIGKGITSGDVKVQLADMERLIRLEMELISDPAAEGSEVDSPRRHGVVIYLPHNFRDGPPPEGFGPPPPDDDSMGPGTDGQ